MSYIDKWDKIFESFQLYFPAIADDVVDWYPSGSEEITAILKDRSRVIYNAFDQVLRTIDDAEIVEDDWVKEFGRRLDKQIRFNFTSQKELADKTGISTSAISNYIKGKGNPSMCTVLKLAAALNCSVTSLTDFNNSIKRKGFD